MSLRLTDYEIQEWHEYVLRQRDRYRCFLQDICSGVPTVPGMACEYKAMSLSEIKERAKKLLRDER